MQQYVKTKEQYKDCILFYRLGDFYEMFFEDALISSRELEITLTGKDCGLDERAPMAGIPFHAAEGYIARLIEKGYKVAICEQLEDPKETKGIVKRDVVRIVTPGTVIESNMLEEKKNNYIMSIYKNGVYFGMSVCDMTTGDFYSTQIKENNNFEKLLDEIAKFSPAEVVVNDLLFNTNEECKRIKDRFNVFISKGEESSFKTDYKGLNYNFVGTNGDKIEKLDDYLLCIASVNALSEYITSTQKVKLEHINKIVIYNTTQYMTLDLTARRNLELTERMRDTSKKGTLLWVLDKTNTSMGGRLLRKWIAEPLVDVKAINKRLEAVEEFKESLMLRDDVIELLKKVYDIERLVGKISYGNANGKDMISLKNSIYQIPFLKQVLARSGNVYLKELCDELDELQDIYGLIDKAIVDEPPISITEGDLIKLGFNEELDGYKMATTEGKKWLLNIEMEEKHKTGIKNLKISYNKIFGYYLEVTKSYLSMVPDTYIRRQTLANCERFVTTELKEVEEKIVGAQERMFKLEYDLFLQVRKEISENITRIQKAANIISTLDVLCSFAKVAEDNNYAKPVVDNEGELNIKEGRHPVIEKMINFGEFITNDTLLDKEANRFAIITGPNMAGKSTYMRQVALITLMAQIGSFVPATEAKIGVVDKIFTRIGAADDLSMGQSTFMVEMMEVANIMKNCTSNSLVILDEIGRGTSTYDGLSIAWAVSEYMADKEKCGAKTLFATHYHELTALEEKLEGVKNYSIAVKENGEDIIFLRKIVNGGTDESYGIHVAKLAGVNNTVIKRANQVLRTIERKGSINTKDLNKGGSTTNSATGCSDSGFSGGVAAGTSKKQVEGQFNFYNYKLAEIAHELDKIDLNELTPINALNTLVKIKEKMMP